MRVDPCEECEIINIETDEIETAGYDDLTAMDSNYKVTDNAITEKLVILIFSPEQTQSYM